MTKLSYGLLSMIVPLVVEALIKGLSPDIRKFIAKFINDLEIKAKATKNPFDDAAVEILKSIIPPNGL